MRSRSSAVRPLPGPAATALLRWFRAHRRPLPWRANRDPYRVWVAEVLLQQTRVAQAIPYFERFVKEFPTVESLAQAPVSRVLKTWEGAGYYARAHHLHAAARVIVRERDGRLPRTAAELETLPGVGPYIARAVAAIAFDAPEVALEANGVRVAARLGLERGDVRAPRVRARLERALRDALPSGAAGPFNEAVMELGETVCLPRNPRCDVCPVPFACRARQELEDPGVIPRRRPKTPRPHVRASVVVLADRAGRWLVQQRPPAGLLSGLWEFPGGKVEAGERPEEAAVRELREETGLTIGALDRVGTVRHGYSHFTVELHVYAGHVTTGDGPARRSNQKWVSRSQLDRLPLPKATEKVIRLMDTVDRDRPVSGPRRG